VQIMEMVREYGIDYFDSALLPLDNYISRGTEHFLGDPGYLTSLNAVRHSRSPIGSLHAGEQDPKFGMPLSQRRLWRCLRCPNAWASDACLAAIL